jgi:hypothetical protein
MVNVVVGVGVIGILDVGVIVGVGVDVTWGHGTSPQKFCRVSVSSETVTVPSIAQSI